jgi:hypothetical protein
MVVCDGIRHLRLTRNFHLPVHLCSYRFSTRKAVLILLSSLTFATGCSRFKAKPAEQYVYVTAKSANLRDRVAAVSNRTGAVTNGDRLKILDHGRHFLKVQTEKGEIGWIEEKAVATGQAAGEFDKLKEQHKADPEVASAVVRDSVYMHLKPGRDSERFYLLAEGEKLKLLKRATLIKSVNPALVARAQKPIPQAAGSDAKRKGAAPPPPPPAPPAPGAPAPLAGTLPQAAQFPLELADTALIVSALGGLLAVSATMALMLALGPLFIVSLLFTWTRGLFVAWVRVLLGAMLGTIAVPLVLALDLGIVERQVISLRNLVDASQPPGFLPLAIVATALASAVVLFALLAAVIRVAAGLQIPQVVSNGVGSLFVPPARAERGSAATAQTGDGPTAFIDSRNRAAQLADAVRAQARRDDGSMPEQVRIVRLAGATQRSDPAAAPSVSSSGPPLGQTGRRIRQRRTIGAQRRDMTT